MIGHLSLSARGADLRATRVSFATSVHLFRSINNANGLAIEEIPVRLIYNDPSRSFGGPLDNPQNRLEVYRRTMHREIIRCRSRLSENATEGLPVSATCRTMRCDTRSAAM